MSIIKKICIWLYMLTKKLFHRWSFLVLLALIPVIIPLLGGVLSDEGGIVKIALCAESDSDEVAHSVINTLISEDSVIKYEIFDNREEAVRAVEQQKCDAAWIFDAKFKERMNAYVDKESIKPFMQIVEREDTISLMLAREKLFGSLYTNISYKIFDNFVSNELLPDKNLSDETIKKYFDAEKQNVNLIEIKMIGSDKVLNISDSNYLKTPLRGLLSLLIMLCGFAAAGFFMKERLDGMYDWLSPKSKIIPAFGSCFAAVFVSALVVFASLYAGGLNVDFVTEFCSMLVYIFATTSFCVFLTACFRSFVKFGPFIPFLMIIMLVLCPIFFSFRFLHGIQLLIPAYYYLMSVYSFEYVWYMAIYSVVTMIVSYALYTLRSLSGKC
ncbi:MAG: hypothetical protein IJB70_05890 [Clostridia bacterium]|nr:hypothetical protein [Clostridia bacterium]